jgi:hypothetical protein
LGRILVPREVYEQVRTKPRPILDHATYHEGWRSVVYDEKTGEAVVVLEGGV